MRVIHPGTELRIVRSNGPWNGSNATPKAVRVITALFVAVLSLAPQFLHAENPPRVTRDLLALYAFDAGEGDTVHDRSGVGRPLDLKIDESAAIRWRDGALVVHSSTKIHSSGPARKIVDAVKRSGGLTIEAWVQPRSVRQTGPARIVSLSAGASHRNFTLGQDGARYDVRMRTRKTDKNGLPSTATPTGVVKTAPTQVVYTRAASGAAQLYIDGKRQASKNVPGKLSNWNDGFALILANEATNDRPWLGTFHLVAVYGRALTADEVGQNFHAGVEAKPRPALARNPNAELFETRIASLLSRHCLECHDSAAKKGGLDLSKKAAAFSGGESGIAIVPGKSAESLLWRQVESGDMPPEGDPLSRQQRALFRQWIDAGATWSLKAIDPAIYAHEESSRGNWIRRLTVPEYIETVRSAADVDISKEARELLPPDVRADGFSNTAYNLSVDLKHVEAYARLAEIIVGRMDLSAFAGKFSKTRRLTKDKDVRRFVAVLGKRLLRGPLDDREITNYTGIATGVAGAGGDFEEAVSYIVGAMLQAPRFIYRVENQRGAGTGWPIGQHELASRMSYIIWGGPPDEKLMRAADAGELSERPHCAAQVRRMLEDPRAIEHSSHFLAEWLDLSRLDNLNPDRNKFPTWDPRLAVDMRAETLAFFKYVAWERKRPLSDLLNAQVTFATPLLAKHYGLEPKGDSLARYDVSSVPGRGGLLTQGSVLTVGGDDASMVTRGLFVLRNLLRGTVKDPPPGLDTTPVPSKPGLSQRRIAEQRIASAACAGCHSKFEPLAFGFEKFDGLGAHHEKDEYGNVLRDDGEILFPGTAEPVQFQTSAELGDLLASSERVRETITWKVTQFALGRPLVAADAPIIEKIQESARKGGATYKSLITAIVMSDLVQRTRTAPKRLETDE